MSGRKENGLLWQELQISQQRQQFLQHSLSKANPPSDPSLHRLASLCSNLVDEWGVFFKKKQIVARILDKLQSLDDVDSNKRKFTEVAGDSAAPSAAAAKAVASPKMRQVAYGPG